MFVSVGCLRTPQNLPISQPWASLTNWIDSNVVSNLLLDPGICYNVAGRSDGRTDGQKVGQAYGRTGKRASTV